ncbi:hypothetical protein BCR39DRAFT_532681 [Naematelia encephala]|uniref:Formin binding protein n=1 Tax=Naematelia encephala TaxID=71784 RepID=A0A1Y2B3R7_9TREE|nr:hypothetical protein BCR39DRAFT_532681 [Naematelia encephala]
MSTPAKSPWSEYKNAEGRVYWSHAVTKQSVWEKPDELRTPFERALGQTDWKSYVHKDRPYYVNSRTKETKWDMPEEVKALKAKIDAQEEWEELRAARKQEGLPSPPPLRSESPELEATKNNALEWREMSESPQRSVPPVETVVIPMGGFLSHEKAEAAFMHLLKKTGVDETWTWDQTMRKIIMDPLYKALDTLAEKKAAFEKFCVKIVADRRAEREAKMAKYRPALVHKLAATHQVKSYSTMKTAEKVMAHDRHWRELHPDDRRAVLEEYVQGLKNKEEAAECDLRQRNMSLLASILRELDINVGTSWRAALDMITSSPPFKADPSLQLIETIDILSIYDDYSRQLEKEHEEESRRYRIDQVRRGRKAREGFKALLSELETRGDLTRTSKWKNTLPKIRDDPRYTALLGLPGSSPLDLWMDAVDDLQEEAERAAEKAERVLGKPATLEMTWEEFERLLEGEQLDSKREAYDLIHERLAQAAADEARRTERKRRHRIDDLRYALKKVQRHIDLDMTYDEAVPHMQDLPEFKDITDEEDRKSAFDKFIKRQKEKLREVESSDVGSARSDRGKSHRDERRDSTRHDRDKERDRDHGRSERERDPKVDRERDREKGRDRDRDRDHGKREKDRDHDRSERRRRTPEGEREPKRPRISDRKEEPEEGEI